MGGRAVGGWESGILRLGNRRARTGGTRPGTPQPQPFKKPIKTTLGEPSWAIIPLPFAKLLELGNHGNRQSENLKHLKIEKTHFGAFIFIDFHKCSKEGSVGLCLIFVWLLIWYLLVIWLGAGVGIGVKLREIQKHLIKSPMN